MKKKTYFQPTIKTKALAAENLMLTASNTMGDGVQQSKQATFDDEPQPMPAPQSVWDK